MAGADSYRCADCGATYGKWVGKCVKCGSFGTIVENSANSKHAGVGVKSSMQGRAVAESARRVADIDPDSRVRHTPTGIGEFDRVLGGGLVPGQVLLVYGEPGVGKSTLLLYAGYKFAETGRDVLYVSGEESAEQISLRARRISAVSDNLYIASETDLSAVLTHIEEVNPDLVIVDSVQTIASPDVDGRVGGMAQVHEVATVLTRVAKTRRCNMQLIGQVTKTSDAAGPQTLTHLVDTVLAFNGDPNTGLRLLRSVKNRNGPADEIACFEQSDAGILEVPDPSGLFSTGRDTPLPGVAVTITMEGRRPLVTEIQALVSPTNAPNPRRGVSGLEFSRAAMLVAVTEKHGRLRLFDKDSFLATVAGMKVVEPAADMATSAALYSAGLDLPVPIDTVFLGEIALSGDVRKIQNLKQRLAEAKRLGYKRAFVPEDSPTVSGIRNIPVAHIRDVFEALNQLASDSSRR